MILLLCLFLTENTSFFTTVAPHMGLADNKENRRQQISQFRSAFLSFQKRQTGRRVEQDSKTEKN